MGISDSILQKKGCVIFLDGLNDKDKETVINSFDDFLLFIELSYLIDNFEEIQEYLKAIEIVEKGSSKYPKDILDEATYNVNYYMDFLDRNQAKRINNLIHGDKNEAIKKVEVLKNNLNKEIGNVSDFNINKYFSFLPKIQKAILIMERKRKFGAAAAKADFFIDGQLLEKFSNGMLKSYILTPGLHKISIYFDKYVNQKDIEINLEPNQKRHYIFSPGSRGIMACLDFEEIY